MTYLVPRMTRREMQTALDALKAPLRFPRAEGGFVPPAEPTDQEHDMSDRDRRAEAELYFDEAESVESHKESVALSSAGALSALLAIHDLLDERLPRRGIDLTPQEFTDFLAAAKAEPVGVTEEPPERRVTVTITDVFAVPDEHGYLRINVGPETAVIDQNASNVTVTDVDTAPDVDPDEALALVAYNAFTGGIDDSIPLDLQADWRDAARAAREHIEAEWKPYILREQSARETAQDDVERLTRERGQAIDRNSPPDVTPLLERECEQQRVRAEYAEDRTETTRQALLKAEGERDFQTARADDLGIRVQKAEAKVERLTRERDDAIGRSVTSRSALLAERWRRANLRGDVALYATHWVRRFGSMDRAEVVAVMNGILRRDDERGRS